MRKLMVTLLYIGFTLGFIIGVVLTALVSSLSVPDGNLHLYTSGFSDFIKNPVRRREPRPSVASPKG